MHRGRLINSRLNNDVTEQSRVARERETIACPRLFRQIDIFFIKRSPLISLIMRYYRAHSILCARVHMRVCVYARARARARFEDRVIELGHLYTDALGAASECSLQDAAIDPISRLLSRTRISRKI